MFAGPDRDNVALEAIEASPKEVDGMREICFCGRSGEVEDREPVSLDGGERALVCPDCGHIDRVNWLSGEARTDVLGEAAKRHARRKPPTAA
jgi:hypothetical protein